MSTRLMQRGVPTHPRPTPTAAPSPISDYGPPPAGVALIYVQDANHPGWYIGFDWTGKPRGTIKLAAPVNDSQQLTQAPDGSGFVIKPLKALGGQYLDRLGQPVATDSGQYQSEMWADDNAHLCTLSGQVRSPQWRIGLGSPGAVPSAHAVAIQINQGGDFALAFSSCSARNDRAVLTYNVFGRQAEVWVVRISDGSILSHQTYSANILSDIVASNDSTLIAENSSKSVGYLGGATAPQTVIRRVSDNAVIHNLDPSYGVVAFNRDDTQALIYTSPMASGVPTQLALVDVRTGAILWRSDGRQELSATLVQPDGGGFAILLRGPSPEILHQAVSTVIVKPDGSEIDVPGRYLQP